MHILSPVTDNYPVLTSGRNESMWPDQVSNWGPLALESDELATALHCVRIKCENKCNKDCELIKVIKWLLHWPAIHYHVTCEWHSGCDSELPYYRYKTGFFPSKTVQKSRSVLYTFTLLVNTVDLQWLKHWWLVYHGSIKLVFESLGKNTIAVGLG